MEIKLLFIAAFLIITGCGNTEHSVEQVDNPPYKPNVEFQRFEDLNHPGFQQLIMKYQQAFRTINSAHVTGPEHKVIIDSK